MNFYSAENKLFLKLSHLNKHLPTQIKYILYTSRISLWWKLCHCHQFNTDKALRNKRLVKHSYYALNICAGEQNLAWSSVQKLSILTHVLACRYIVHTCRTHFQWKKSLSPISHHVCCTPAQCVKYLQEPSHCYPFHIMCAAHLHSVLNICRNQVTVTHFTSCVLHTCSVLNICRNQVIVTHFTSCVLHTCSVLNICRNQVIVTCFTPWVLHTCSVLNICRNQVIVTRFTPAQCVKYLQEPTATNIYYLYFTHAAEWTGEGRNKRGQFYGHRWFQDIACPDAFGSDGAKREDLLCTHTRWHSRPCRCATPRYPIYSWNKHTEIWLLPSHYVKDTGMAH